LKDKEHKNLLVATFEKRLMASGPDNVKVVLAEFKRFANDIGYERVLVLGAHGFGILVLYDSSER
jgi:hypothetical protein